MNNFPTSAHTLSPPLAVQGDAGRWVRVTRNVRSDEKNKEKHMGDIFGRK
jgi:hypothetical protein